MKARKRLYQIFLRAIADSRDASLIGGVRVLATENILFHFPFMFRIFAVLPEGNQKIGIFDTIETAEAFAAEIEAEGELTIEIEKAVDFA